MRRSSDGRYQYNKFRRSQSGHGKAQTRHMSVLLVLTLLLSVLAGCTEDVPDGIELIKCPENASIPISGSWRLINSPGESGEIGGAAGNAPLSGKIIEFYEDAVQLAGSNYTDVSYKIKRVKTDEYFLHKNVFLPDKLGITGKVIFIVTVYSKDNYLFELIKDENGKFVAMIDGQYYFLGELSDDYRALGGTKAETAALTEKNVEDGKDGDLRSGMLLGVRIPVKTKDGLGDYRYRTYWISGVNRVIQPILFTDDIYFPRKDGFWKLKVDKIAGAYGVEDTLTAYKVTDTQKVKNGAVMYESLKERFETGVRKAILYVGNDFICVENTFYAGNGDLPANGVVKTLRTLPVDSLSSVDGITISDIFGENGTLAMENAISELLKNTGTKDIILINSESQSKNFSLYRKTGHWFLKGRIGLKRQGQLPYVDFTLNLLPPSNMVAYDVLHIPWTEVKDKLPDAVDIYTSPNVDLAVVLTPGEIQIYAIENNSLSDEPLATVQLEKGSAVVMAEWCLGNYVSAWEKSFIKNNETRQVGNANNN